MVDGWLFSGQNQDFTLYTALNIFLYIAQVRVIINEKT